MKFLIAVLILRGAAYGQNNIFNIRDLSLTGDSLRVKLDDLRYTLENMPPAIKEQLQTLLTSIGSNVVDLERALTNPSEEVEEIFGPSGISISDMKAAVDNLPRSIKQIFKNKWEL